MITRTKYSVEFKEQALSKVLRREEGRTVESVAGELGMNALTLKGWMKTAIKTAKTGGKTKARAAEQWPASERLIALHETHGLQGEALSAWCRQRGVFSHQLERWRIQFCTPPAQENTVALRELRRANVELERQLNRKDKALAEAAALLVLQKKYRALLGGEAP